MIKFIYMAFLGKDFNVIQVGGIKIHFERWFFHGVHIKDIQLHVLADFQFVHLTVVVGLFLQFALHVSLVADLFQPLFGLGCMNAMLGVINVNGAVHIVELD